MNRAHAEVSLCALCIVSKQLAAFNTISVILCTWAPAASNSFLLYVSTLFFTDESIHKQYQHCTEKNLTVTEISSLDTFSMNL